MQIYFLMSVLFIFIPGVPLILTMTVTLPSHSTAHPVSSILYNNKNNT